MSRVWQAAVATLALGTSGCSYEFQEAAVARHLAFEPPLMQSRTIPGYDGMDVMRATLAAFLDRGYSIGKVDIGTMTVIASKADDLNVRAVIQAGPNEVILQTGATLMKRSPFAPLPDTVSVVSPVFYQQDFYQPVMAALQLARSR